MEIISRSEAKEKGLKHYFTGKPCPHGHVSERFVSSFGCTVCAKKCYDEHRKKHPEKHSEYQKKHYEANRQKCISSVIRSQKRNRERHLKNKRDYHHRNNEQVRERQRLKYRKTSEAVCAYQKEYRKNNREKLNEYYRKYNRERRANDPDFKMRHMASYMVRRVLEKTGNAKANKTEETLGYTGKELRAHVERNMASDMNWENYGALWQIDHIVPVMEMIKQGIKDPAKINALSNLMPEYKDVNMAKGDRFALTSRPKT